MALSQLFWDVLMPWNLKSTYFSLKMIHFLSLNIWYVIYVVFWIKYWNLKLPHHCILFLFTICTVSQLFWNRVCSYQVHQELQMKVENSKLYQSSQSLHLQLAYHRNLQKELIQAEQAIQWLGNLAALADRMTVQNLVTISKWEITAFLKSVLKVRDNVLILNCHLIWELIVVWTLISLWWSDF